MNKTEILQELPNLTPEERLEIRARIDELDESEDEEWDDLPQAERDLIEKRLANIDKNPESLISWDEFQARRKARTRK